MNHFSLLGSLRINLRYLDVDDSKLTGDLASYDTAYWKIFKPLVIYDFKLPGEGELAFNNEGPSRTIMRGLENSKIEGRNLVKKNLITGHCCQSLQSLKIWQMENLVEIDLARKILMYLTILLKRFGKDKDTEFR